MENYKIKWKKTAFKEIKKLEKPIVKKIIPLIERLKKNPRPDGCKKIKGQNKTYRIRKGNYRVVYKILNETLVIVIITVGHRKNIYR